MNKKIYFSIIAIIAVIFVYLLLNKDSDDDRRSLKKGKILIEDIVLKLNVYKDGVPLRLIRIRPVKPRGLKGKINYKYRWYVNGEEQNDEGYNLKISSLKKGDTIYCLIMPEYRNKKLKEVKTEVITIPNSPPKLQYNEIGNFTVPGTFKYQIRAVDPDEDEITYELLDPLDRNIMIDSFSGEISWEITEKEPTYYIKIKYKVTDSDGAVTLGEIDLDLKRGTEIRG